MQSLPLITHTPIKAAKEPRTSFSNTNSLIHGCRGSGVGAGGGGESDWESGGTGGLLAGFFGGRAMVNCVIVYVRWMRGFANNGGTISLLLLGAGGVGGAAGGAFDLLEPKPGVQQMKYWNICRRELGWVLAGVAIFNRELM